MAKWIEFERDVDYRHKSRAVTAYKKGMVEYVPNHIIEGLPEGSFKETDKPDSDSGEVWLNG